MRIIVALALLFVPALPTAAQIAPIAISPRLDEVNDINNAGQVVGRTEMADGWYRAYVWAATTGLIDLGPASGFSSAYAINSRGAIAGSLHYDNRRAAMWTAAGELVQIGTLPGAPHSEATAINDAGHVIGFSGNTDPYPYAPRRAFRWTAASGMTDLGTLGGHSTVATAINASGQIVGFSTTASNEERAFLWTEADGMIDLGTLGGTSSRAYDINDHGYVVGQSSNAVGELHPFLWTPELGMIDLGSIGTYSWASDINNRGQVIGNAHMKDGGVHPFLWTNSTGLIDLDPNSYFSSVLEINERGDILGRTSVSAFVWTHRGKQVFLDGPNGSRIGSWGYAINDSGVVIGQSYTSTWELAATMWKVPAMRLEITTPNTRSAWGANTRQRLSWTYYGGASQFLLEVSYNGGRLWDYVDTVENKPGPSQNYYWRVTGPSTSNARLRATAIGDEEATDTNDADIRISNASISVIAPFRRTTTFVGNQETIFFSHNLGARKPVAIDVSGDGGATWRNLAHTTTNGATTSSFRWSVDLAPTSNARVRVRALDGTGATARSEDFSVRTRIRTTVLEGSVSVNFDNDGYYRLASEHFTVSHGFAPFFPCDPSADVPCEIGQRVDMSSRIAHSTNADWIIDGRRYPYADIEMSFTIEPITVKEGSVTAPFVMQGRLRGLAREGGRPLAQVEFTATGTMFVHFWPPDDPASTRTNFGSLALVIEQGTTRVTQRRP